jgi:hypothetical protein
MSSTNTIARSLSEVGLAAWFGGSLMGAVGVNGAASEVDPLEQRARVANAGWSRWTPVNAAAIGAHLVGSVVLTGANKGRIVGQKNVASTAIAKTAVTAGALAATAYARVLGQKMISAGDVPVEGGTDPSAQTPPEVAAAQRKLNVMQWTIPALTGALLVMDALMGEQQRPSQAASGFVQRLLPDSLAA